MIVNYDKFLSIHPASRPVRHRRKVPFTPKVSIELSNKKVMQEIRMMDMELDRFILSAADYLELVTEAYASNIHWSTSLEGNPLSEEEVVRLTRQTFAGKEEKGPGPQQEIINHLHGHFMRDRLKLPWSPGTIRSVHSMLTEDTGTEGIPGEFRRTHASVYDGGAEAFIACPGARRGGDRFAAHLAELPGQALDPWYARRCSSTSSRRSSLPRRQRPGQARPLSSSHAGGRDAQFQAVQDRPSPAEEPHDIHDLLAFADERLLFGDH